MKVKFLVERTTNDNRKSPPCEEAIKGDLLRQENTNTDGYKWYREYQPYYIEFGTLEDLQAFVLKYGDVVIEKAYSRVEYFPELADLQVIEIYDGYRE